MAQHQCNKGWVLMPNDEGDMVPFFVQVRGEDVHEIIDESLARLLQTHTGIYPLDYKLIGGKVYTKIDCWDCEFSNSMTQESGGKSIAELRTYRRLGDLVRAGFFKKDSSNNTIAHIEIPVPIPFFATNILCNITAGGVAYDWMKCIATPEVVSIWGDNEKYISLTGDNQKVKINLAFNTAITNPMINPDNLNNCHVGISVNLCGHYVNM